MTIHWTLYDEVTGAIIASGDALTEASANLQATGGGRIVLVGSDPATQVVDVTAPPANTSTLPKTPISVSGTQIGANKTTFTANGTDSVTISPIPSGATYKVDAPQNLGIAEIPSNTVSDGSLVITTTVAGVYTVTIKYSTNLDYVVSLNAT